jgi:hypothetical protein
MEFMARKGFDSEEILQGIPGVLNAIAASGEGMAEVATVVGSSIRGFGLEAKEAGYVANVLAFTAEKTGAKITDMGTALAIAAPTAKALGVSIEDTAAAVGLLQKTGIDSSTAGSAVATMLAKISHPSKEAADKMKAMGIKFKDAKGNMLSFRDVLGQFIKAGDKAGGNMDKMSFFAELVGLARRQGGARARAHGEVRRVRQAPREPQEHRQLRGKGRGRSASTRRMGSGSCCSPRSRCSSKLFQLKSGALRQVIDQVNAWIQANQNLIVTKRQRVHQRHRRQHAEDRDVGHAHSEDRGGLHGVFRRGEDRQHRDQHRVFRHENPYVALALAIVAAIALIIAYWPEISAFFSRLWASIKTGAAAVGAWFSRLWANVTDAF